MDYPNGVYSWNRFQSEAPAQSTTGLAEPLTGANLPIIIPSNEINDLVDAPYSPVLMEMGVGPAGLMPARHVPDAPAPNTPLPTPAYPGLWLTVTRAIVGGNMTLKKSNSTAVVASNGGSGTGTGSV